MDWINTIGLSTSTLATTAKDFSTGSRQATFPDGIVVLSDAEFVSRVDYALHTRDGHVVAYSTIDHHYWPESFPLAVVGEKAEYRAGILETVAKRHARTSPLDGDGLSTAPLAR